MAEARYRAIIEAVPDAILVTDGDGFIVFTNSAAVDLFAAESRDRLIGLDMMKLIHLKDREDVEKRRQCVLLGFTPPFAERSRLRLDGSEFMSESRGVPVTWNGEPAILLVVRDITPRKQAEAALQNLSARLINAHEDERGRIARELHDDFSQSLAILTVDLELFRDRLPESQQSFADFLASQIQRTKEISSRLQTMTHQLQPFIIEHIGLVSAIRSLCNELSERYDLKIAFTHQDIPRGLSKNVSLCVFRIVQKALRNVIKHSGAQTALVELNATPAEVVVRILDTGSGSIRRAIKCGKGSGFSACGNGFAL